MQKRMVKSGVVAMMLALTFILFVGSDFGMQSAKELIPFTGVMFLIYFTALYMLLSMMDKILDHRFIYLYVGAFIFFTGISSFKAIKTSGYSFFSTFILMLIPLAIIIIVISGIYLIFYKRKQKKTN